VKYAIELAVKSCPIYRLRVEHEGSLGISIY
jgi:hypothetical protein